MRAARSNPVRGERNVFISGASVGGQEEGNPVPKKEMTPISGSEAANRTGRVISELVMAEIFFVQATIESATALGDGLGALRRRWSANDEERGTETVSELLSRTRREVLEPYSERIDVFRKLIDRNQAA